MSYTVRLLVQLNSGNAVFLQEIVKAAEAIIPITNFFHAKKYLLIIIESVNVIDTNNVLINIQIKLIERNQISADFCDAEYGN